MTEPTDAPEPKAGTKAALEQEVADLQAENARLQAQLAAGRQTGAGSPAGATFVGRPTFRSDVKISEGERAGLETNGVITDVYGTGLLYADDYGIVVTTEEGRTRLAKAREKKVADERAGLAGLDYVSPTLAEQ